ncbi:MAG TPA: ribosome maturation factor RimP [Egibacteraceae bacterium]|nr:ribosome maturation factor RimP [Egibacteraceae bacterium]
MAGLTDTVRALAEPLAADADVDLVDLQVKGSGSRQLVRVVVDRKGGVDLATCQRLSQRLSARLDEADPFPSRYSLEVTSPGIDHPLADRRAFERVEGRDVLVHRDAGDGRVVQLRGRVLIADEEAVVIETGGERVGVRYDDIVKATQSLPW